MVPVADRAARLEWRDFGQLAPTLLYELLRFRQAIFVVEQRCAYPDLDGLDQAAHHLLARRRDELSGYLRLIPFAAKARVAIGRVAVAPEHRGRRLARMMMQEALARCRRDWPEFAVALSAQSYLVPFYKGLGFRVTSPAYDDYGVPHLDMALLPLKG